MRLSANKMVNVAIVVAFGVMLSIGTDRYLSKNNFANSEEIEVVDSDGTVDSAEATINAYDNSTVIINQIMPYLGEEVYLPENQQSQVNPDAVENYSKVEKSEAVMQMVRTLSEPTMEPASVDEFESNLLVQIMRMITKVFLIFCLGVGILMIVIGVIVAVCKKL